MNETAEIPKPSETNSETYIKSIRSEKFIDLLKKSAELTRTTGYEHAFSVGTKNSKFCSSLIIKGGTDSMERNYGQEEEGTSELGDDWYDADFFVQDLAKVHFHPSGGLVPSEPDLGTMAGSNEIEDAAKKQRSTAGIGVVDKEGNINLLLIRVLSARIPSRHLFKDLVDSFDEFAIYSPDSLLSDATKDEILSILNNGFLRATILSLGKDEERWSEPDNEKIKQFFK